MVRDIQIQTTSVCNSRCVICPHKDSLLGWSGARMSDRVFDKVCEALAPHVWNKVAFYLQAEPLTDPKIFDRARELKRRVGFKYMEISTNCGLLDEAATREIIDLSKVIRLDVWLSFQGTNQDSFEAATGMPYFHCLENLQRFMHMTDGVDLGRMIMCVGHPESIPGFWRPMWRNLGVRREPRYEVAPPITRAGNVPGTEKRFSKGGKNYLGCDRLSNWVHVNWLGQMIPCCMDYNNEIVFGSLLKEPLMSILARIPRVMQAHERSGFLCYRCEKG